MPSTIQVRVDEDLKRNVKDKNLFATMTEDELLEKLSLSREHSIQGKQREANAVISDMRAKEIPMEHVTRQERKLVHKGSILDIYQDRMLLPNGKEELWDFVSHRKGAAAVLPVLPDGRIVLVHQYRPALERMTWEVPAGCRDSLTEDTLVSATRELKEETGYEAKTIEFLISLKTTVAFCDEFIDVYLATGLTPGEQQLDEAEAIEIGLFTMEELLTEIFAGRLQDSKTVSAILAYHAKLNEAKS